MDDEATRAAVWCQEHRARAAQHQAFCAMLAGDPAAYARVLAAWQPYIDAVKEARDGGEGLDQQEQDNLDVERCPSINA